MPAFTSRPHSFADRRPVLISRPAEDRRLSLPEHCVYRVVLVIPTTVVVDGVCHGRA